MSNRKGRSFKRGVVIAEGDGDQIQGRFAKAERVSATYFTAQEARHRKSEVADESLDRTRRRARMYAQDRELFGDTVYLDDAAKAQKVVRRTAKAVRPKGGGSARSPSADRESPADQDHRDANSMDGIAHVIAAQVDEIKDRMPSSSLMECIHHAASHYYDARQMLEHKEASTSRESYGMATACEGSALVAMAVFVEELAAWEAGVRTKTTSSVESPSDAALLTVAQDKAKAWPRLQELRQDVDATIRRNLRRIKRRNARLAETRTMKEPLKDTILWPYDLHD